VRQTKDESNTRLRFWPHFWKSLAAILTGNAIYFLIMAPRLPAAARHAPGRLDVGLLIDFWVCLVCFGLLALLKFIGHMDARRR
jgi:high-affinity K+ transport system ATPase subunit B